MKILITIKGWVAIPKKQVRKMLADLSRKIHVYSSLQLSQWADVA